MSAFVERIKKASRRTHSLVCVGLDPDPARMALPDVLAFNQSIVDATVGLVCAYKPNLAFYEALGLDGLRALEGTLDFIRAVSPDAVIIGDAKRGDIGPSAEAYAKAMFDVWGYDAITVNAWGGHDSVAPFLQYPDRGVFVWCRGSNPGSADFQDLETTSGPLYRRMASACASWNDKGNVGLVVGATVPEQLAAIRAECPDMPLLIPGVGAQGGDLEQAVRLGTDAAGRLALINSSRGIIYASSGDDFAERAAEEAHKLRDGINAVLSDDGLGWS